MAFDMHLKFQGGTVQIEGASQHSKHKNEVPIIAWSWGSSNTGNLHTGAGYAAGGKANVQDISVTKFIDGCSHLLLNACCTGSHADEAWLYVTNATGEQTDFLEIHLKEGVMITSVATGGTGGEDRLTENVTLHFGAFEYTYYPQDDKGKKQGSKKFQFNMQEVKAA